MIAFDSSLFPDNDFSLRVCFLDNITDKKMALTARNMLKSFYSAIKDSDEYIKFVFITGVSKFSKMNLFSGLNPTSPLSR